MDIRTQVIKLNWKYKIVYSILIGLIYSGVLCLLDYFTGNNLQSVKEYIIHGIVFGFLMGYVFTRLLISEKFGRRSARIFGIKPELNEGEEIEVEGPTNLFRGIEGVEGKIFLTNTKLIFKSHKINIQKGQAEIEYHDIKEIVKRKNSNAHE
ncbi:GRAM domain-containing protein [Carboxylicivirga taeanensis]|uniref:GRAM domain-containing protein n=1 Tax=Carboxylicivirga taeanensis TaxID=1416875 RepID=UPI003F6DBA33